MANKTGDNVCIGGDRYKVADSTMTGTEAILDRLDRILDALGVGDNTPKGGIRSFVVTLPPNERMYPINFGIKATQINIRSDGDLSIYLNDPNSQSLDFDFAEFPFSIDQLSEQESIDTVYVTSKYNTRTATSGYVTTVRILAIGNGG